MPLVNPCVTVTLTSRDLCVRFPVGTQVCASIPQVTQVDPSELLLALFGQVNSALAPLSPIFSIIDAVVAVFDCVKAIPDAIVKLDPFALIECLPPLADAVNALLQLIPQASLPILIIDIIDGLILFLQAQIALLDRIIDKLDAIIEVTTRSQEPGQFALRGLIDCFNANFNADLLNLNEAFAPVNRLIGIVNAFLELLGLPCIPQIGSVGDIDAIETFREALVELVAFLQYIRNLIPLPPSGSLSSSGITDC